MHFRYSGVGLAFALVVFSGCATTAPPAQAPAATAAGTSAAAPAATEAATTAAAPAGNDADALVGQLSAAMAGVKTYSFDMTMETETMGKPVNMTSKGSIDQSDPANKKMSMDVDMLGMKMKMLQVDGELYLQSELLGEKWMLVPEAQRAQYDQAANTGDLAASFEKSKAAIKGVKLVGDEDVDGTATKHYVVSYDPSALPSLTGGTGEVAGDSLEYHMWVDADSLIRKVSLEGKMKADSDEMPLKLVGKMGDYNKPVTIEAPSKDDLMEMPG